MTVYLAPDVYWLHDPEDEEIFRGTEGEFLPYQQKIKCNYLSLIGLSEHPEDVVIAANKGQSHGCIGNYTMLHFEGDGLYLENLTIGNYCNVDLEYPLDPSKTDRSAARQSHRRSWVIWWETGSMRKIVVSSAD